MPHDGLPKGAPGVTVSLLVDAQEPEWDAFVRATHLKESAVPLYTEKLAGALEPHLR